MPQWVQLGLHNQEDSDVDTGKGPDMGSNNPNIYKYS